MAARCQAPPVPASESVKTFTIPSFRCHTRSRQCAPVDSEPHRDSPREPMREQSLARKYITNGVIMNTFLKVGAAGVLALSYASAHAGIIGAKSSSTPGDLLLFAEVVSSTNTPVAYYVGDTTVSVGGLNPASGLSTGALISTSTDTKLSALLAANVAGTTLEWAVIGGGYDSSFNVSALTTLTNAAAVTAMTARTQTNTSIMVNTLSNNVAYLNSLINNGTTRGGSYEGATTTKWDTTLGIASNGTNIADWFNNGASNAV